MVHGLAAPLGGRPQLLLLHRDTFAKWTSTLRKRNEGVFPFWHVYRIIDGREPVKGHGTSDMPIWGDTFREEEGTGLAAETRAVGRILAIVYYLQSIQEQ